jgi:hypothetical protein
MARITRPGTPPINTGNGGKVAPRGQFRIAVFGDSLMWGQGVARDSTFKELFRQSLVPKHPKEDVVLVDDYSRSGAQMRLRDGNVRDEFVDRYPDFFPDEASQKDFTEGNEEAAHNLFGEIPSSLPTVTWQVERLDDELGRSIKVALVCGGANDLAFEDILNPSVSSSKFIEDFEGKIREVTYHDTKDLLKLVRAKCPNAVIVLFGYHLPISYESDYHDIKNYFKFENDNNVTWYLNEVIHFENIDAMIHEARVRSVWAHALSSYWLRKAVADSNLDPDVIGPGIVFSPSGYGLSNAAFAEHSFVHSDYTHPTTDDMQPERVAKTPRGNALDDIVQMAVRVFTGNYEGAKALRAKIHGPTSLEEALFSHRSELGKSPFTLLVQEAHRIQHSFIASFFHPNAAGAKSYATVAKTRYQKHLELLVAIPKLPPSGAAPKVPGPETFEQRLTRFNLRSSAPLKADIGHYFLDTVRVSTKTASSSDKLLGSDIYLVLHLKHGTPAERTRMWRLNFQYYELDVAGTKVITKLYPQFEPGEKDAFYVDTGGHIELSDIDHCSIALSGRRPGKWLALGDNWRPERITLEINGVEVVSRSYSDRVVAPGDNVDLQYPAPFIQQLGPVVVRAAVALKIPRISPDGFKARARTGRDEAPLTQ